MPRLEITPWRNEDELLRVRKQLYPEKYGSDVDQRRDACNRACVLPKKNGLDFQLTESRLLCGSFVGSSLMLWSPLAP